MSPFLPFRLLFSEGEIDPDLRTVIGRWDGLSVESKRTISRIIR